MSLYDDEVNYTIVAYIVDPSFTTSSIDFSFKTWFFGIYLNFQQ
jgi:hypothetical protein